MVGAAIMSDKSRSKNMVFDTEKGRVPGRRHQNPDGSYGGWVPENMIIPDDVYIHASSYVLPGASLEPGSYVPPRRIVK